MFTSDNGPHQEGGANPDFFNSNGEIKGYKRDLYEGGIRIPFIVSWPGVSPVGIESDHVSAFWDMMPTLAEVVGGKPGKTNGLSFYDVIKNGSQEKKHEYLCWEFHEREGRQAVVMDEWKGVRYGVRDNPHGPVELYNLEADPGERHNVAKENPALTEKISSIMQNARTTSPIFNFGSEPY